MAAIPRRGCCSASSFSRRVTSRPCDTRGAGWATASTSISRPDEPNQRLDAYTVLSENTKITSFEPHLHAPGVRMCLEAIWGINVQTLTCAGYDHNWVRVYEYDDDYAPLLPKGTILHIIGYMDNSTANRNVPDPRNWSGSGNRSISNMFIDLGQGVALTDEQFYAEMAQRREKLKLTPNDVLIGCPLCNGDPIAPPPRRRNRDQTAVARESVRRGDVRPSPSLRRNHEAIRSRLWSASCWACAAYLCLRAALWPSARSCLIPEGRSPRPPMKAGRRTPTAPSICCSDT